MREIFFSFLSKMHENLRNYLVTTPQKFWQFVVPMREETPGSKFTLFGVRSCSIVGDIQSKHNHEVVKIHVCKIKFYTKDLCGAKWCFASRCSEADASRPLLLTVTILTNQFYEILKASSRANLKNPKLDGQSGER